MSGEEEDYSDSTRLLRSSNANTNLANNDNNVTTDHHIDLEAEDSQVPVHRSPRSYSVSPVGFKDLLIKHLDRGFSPRRLSFKRLDRDRNLDRSIDPRPPSPPSLSHQDPHPHPLHHHQQEQLVSASDTLGDSAPPEWALLLIGCLLGLATGLFVAAFNNGVCCKLFVVNFSFCCYILNWQI